MVVVAFFMVVVAPRRWYSCGDALRIGVRSRAARPRTGRSHSFAGQLAGLLHPSGELSFVELVVLMDVEVARSLSLDSPGGTGRSDVPRKKATLTYFVKQWKPRNQPWPSIRRRASSI